MDHEQALFRLFGKFCPEGTILYKEGEPGAEMFLVQSGAVRVGTAGPGGPAWRLLRAEDILGDEAFFAPTPRAQRAEVAQDARLLQVNERTLDTLVRIGPEASLGMLGRLLGRAASAWGDLETWTLGQILRRAEPFLLQTGLREVRDAQLAEQMGIDGGAARRLLLELERLGGLVREGAAFRVVDAALLDRAVRSLSTAAATGTRGSAP